MDWLTGTAGIRGLRLRAFLVSTLRLNSRIFLLTSGSCSSSPSVGSSSGGGVATLMVWLEALPTCGIAAFDGFVVDL